MTFILLAMPGAGSAHSLVIYQLCDAVVLDGGSDLCGHVDPFLPAPYSACLMTSFFTIEAGPGDRMDSPAPLIVRHDR